ncbi:hypothetical protein EDD15DRAFT_2518722 [Pisolithus albus]|nr:hypothetical protein EDD15DRAFT_2518722 [Pisolithus albus]
MQNELTPCRRTPPPRPKQTSAGYCSGHLNLVRIAVLRDLGRISSVALEYLKSAAAPRPQQIDATEIKESLQQRSNFHCRDMYLLLMDKKSIDVHGATSFESEKGNEGADCKDAR